MLYLIRKARTDFSAFCYCVYPGYQFPRHLRELTGILTQIEHTPDARVIVTCPPRHGKCLGGSMRVNLADGRLVSIAELVQQNSPIPVKSLVTKSSTFVDSVASDFVYSGEQLVYRVTLSSGRILECTAEHPLWIRDEWKPLQELHCGQQIATAEWQGQDSEEGDVFSYRKIFWDTILSVVEKGVESTYDMRVSATHNFLVEGIVVHNSLTTSVLFPAYYFGRNPDLKLITASYTAGLTGKFASEIKGHMATPMYQMIFPRTKVWGRAASYWGIAGHGGSILATGVTSAMTGFGADCLTGDTQICTSQGFVRLDRLVEAQERGEVQKVLGIEPGTGRLSYRQVLAVAERMEKEIYTLTTYSGKVLRATGRHRVFVEGQGYRRVFFLAVGDRLISLGNENGAEQQTYRDSIVSIVREDTEPVKVYDIQVEGTGNFFAGEILVHNCLIIDDPIRDAMYADSQSWRERVWEWYSSVAYTRLHPGAPVFVIACMTGDTRVLMAEGTWKELEKIQIGEQVLTWEQGELVQRTVTNWIPQGIDDVLEICTGDHLVRATSRHPFLVQDEKGNTRWVQVKDLRVGDQLVSLSGSIDAVFAPVSISSIQAIGRELVYDLTVDGAESFIAEGLVVHNTRWHHDDLTGRLLLQNKDPDADQWQEVYFPAITGEGGPNEIALWPNRYGLETLHRIRASVGQRTWQALYQGNPTPREGNSFKRWMFSKIVRVEPNDCKKYIRYWDKAGTSGGGDYTVGALVALDAEGRFFLVDVVRGQWAAYERERVIRATAEQDKARIGNRIRYEVWQEQEPGSGGLQSAQATQKSLSGFIVKNDVAAHRGSIENMADVLATQMEAGNFYLVGGHWIQQLLEEFLQYPYGVHDDQVVAVCGAFRGVSGYKSFRVDFI
jgi:predicted phage terminase large subunit-like protein